MSTVIMTTSQFKTLVILDLETTGLVYDEPKITELAMIAIPLSTLDQMSSNEELPRVLNKFVKFFNPRKTIHSKASEVSELDNDMLNNYAPFNHATIVGMEHFLSSFPKPLCFVAHNGNVFDFPILFKEIQSTLSSNQISYSSLTEIACVDSLNFFREIYKLLNETENIETAPSIDLSPSTISTYRRGYVEIPIKSESIQQKLSMKLVQIYEREFNQPPHFQAHRAEDDCLMLLAILKRYLPDWLEWMDHHYQSLSSFASLPRIPRTPKIFSPKNTVNIKRPLKF